MNKTEPIQWRGIRPVDKFILLILPLTAAAIATLSFLDQAFLRRLARLPGARPVVTWLASGYNAWLVAAGILLLTALYLLWVRYRLVSNKRLWYGSGCPNCMEQELVRVSRQTRDRFYKLAGIPAYRYACRNCTWRGLRIARREYSPERELELEEALMRFQPDGLIAANPVRPDDTGEVETPATLTSSRPSSVFRDVGDVNWTEQESPTPAPQIEDDSESEVQANHHDDAELLDGMEWLWHRSSDK